MTKQVQRRRGTSTQHTSFTGAEGEISVNTTNKSIHVHDGTTAGGVEAARADLANVSDTSLNNALSGNTLASLTITSADINGGTIDGTTIGGTSPAAVTGTTITATGDVTIADKIIHAGDTNTAIRFPAADTVTIETAGAERVRVDSSGNVGIGTSSPNSKLHVAGEISSGATGVDGSLILRRSGDGAAINAISYDTSTEEMRLNNGSGVGKIVFQTASTERMRLDTSGNLGLGVTPSAWNSSYKGFQNSGGALVGVGTGEEALLHNSYIAVSGNYTYTNTAAAARYSMAGGVHYWFNAPSGSSGNTITFTQAMTLDASGNLLVGGTSNPYAAGGRGIVQSNGTTSATFGLAVNSVAAGFLFSNGSQMTLGAPSGHPILFDINGERARIDASGNLLVGVTSTFESSRVTVAQDQNASTRLSVRNASTGSSAGAGIVLNGSGNSWQIECGSSAKNSNALTFSLDVTAPSEKMRLDSSGNLGIGTSSPVNKLDVLGDVTVAGFYRNADVTSVGAAGMVINLGARSGSTLTPGAAIGALLDNPATTGVLTFSTRSGGALGERARITSNGNLLVGTTDDGARLNVKASALGVTTFHNTRNVNGDQVLTLANGPNANTTDSYYLICQEPAVANRMFIFGNGNVVNTNNSYGALSDAKLKENIVDSGSQWDDIKAIRVRKYSLKADGLDAPNMIGVVAQEVEAAGMGGLVFESPDLGPDNQPTGEVTKQVNYSILYMKSVKALQEAMTRIEALEARITALEA